MRTNLGSMIGDALRSRAGRGYGSGIGLGQSDAIVPQFPQGFRQLLGPALLGAGVSVLTLFDVADSVVENLPDEPGQAVGDHPNGPVVSQLRQEAAEYVLKVTALLLYRRVRRLRAVRGKIPQPPFSPSFDDPVAQPAL